MSRETVNAGEGDHRISEIAYRHQVGCLEQDLTGHIVL